MAEQSGVQSVERTFLIIELLCRHGERSVTELAAESGLHKTTVYRLLSTLCSLGYVEQNARTERYRLTLKFLRVGTRLLGRFDIRRHGRPLFEELSKKCGETVHLVRRDNSEIVYIDKFESAISSVRMVSQIGMSQPMTNTGVGKAILAEMPDSEIKMIWNSTTHEQKTENTITDFDEFLREIHQIRENGYAVDNEENEIGVRCVAAAIADIDGEYCYAFSVSAPVSRMDDETLKHYAQLVLATKERLEN